MMGLAQGMRGITLLWLLGWPNLPGLCQEASDFQEAKRLWVEQGEREKALQAFERIRERLEPQWVNLKSGERGLLCETLHWMAILEDRSAATKAKVPDRFQTILNIQPNFEPDRTLTSPRLLQQFDGLRASRFAKVEFDLTPQDGQLFLDGKLVESHTFRWIPQGQHTISYARKGYASLEQVLELRAGGVVPIRLELQRVASVLKLYTHPSGAEIYLDGQSIGRSSGSAGAELQTMADQEHLPLGEISNAFEFELKGPGEHRLECRLACHRSAQFILPSDYTQVYSDRTMSLVRLQPSQTKINLDSSWSQGELHVEGRPKASLPVKDFTGCSDWTRLEVRFPWGTWRKTIQLKELETFTWKVKPLPRMRLGSYPLSEFPGKVQLLRHLEELPRRLEEMCCLNRPEDPELLEDLRLDVSPQSNGEVELKIQGKKGQAFKFRVRPLEKDPLAPLIWVLGRTPKLSIKALDVFLFDIKGEAGPVLFPRANPVEGMQSGKALLRVQDQPVSTVADVMKCLQSFPVGPISLDQEQGAFQMELKECFEEIPQGDDRLCYPFLACQLAIELARETDPIRRAWLNFNLGLALMQMKSWDEALGAFDQAVGVQAPGAGLGALHYYRAQCFQQLGDAYELQARQALEEALKHAQSTLQSIQGPPVAPFVRPSVENTKP